MSMLEPPERYHACVCDFGLADVKDDEFHLLRTYSRHAAFVMLTGAPSAEKGFTAASLGAKAVVQKSAGFDYLRFARRVNYYALLNIINPRHRVGARDSLTTSTEVLFAKNPDFVTNWAIELGVTDRELRYIWKKNLGANAKIILFIYQVYRKAFAYYEERLALRLKGGDPGEDDSASSTDEYRRYEEYYHMHRSTICDYLMFGNVVNVMQ
jgi:hypothetical protein